MGDLAKGIKNFKAGLSDDEIHSGDPAQMIDQDDPSGGCGAAKDEGVKS